MIAVRVGSAAIAPLIRKLFRGEEPGAGLVAGPARIRSLVTFRGEKTELTRHDLEKLVRRLVERAVSTAAPHEDPAPAEHEAVVQALADSLSALGDLDMDDVQAVALGPGALAEVLGGHRPAGLSAAAERFHDHLLQVACLHIVDFFTRRSTFVARTVVEEARQTRRLVEAVDLLVRRLPDRRAEDADFEERYRRHLARRHGRLTVFGIDVDDDWPLDEAYVSLETADGDARADFAPGAEHGHRPAPALRAEEALAGRERVLLRGAAGAGKTTLVQWLAVTTAEWRPSRNLAHLFGRVPFVLPLRALTRAGRQLPAPSGFLSAVRCPHTAPAGWAERVLGAGRGLLLVDGIDEVPEPERNGTRRWLRELLAEFPGNACVVTGRPSAVGENWLESEGFHELSLAPMGSRDVTTFVYRWHAASGAAPQEADRVVAAVRSRQDLARLVTNPLMCGLVCALHRAGRGYLPRGREELYEAGLRMLLERRDRQRSIDDGMLMDFRSQVLLLERLAYWLIRNGRSQLEQDDAVALIEQVLPGMRRDALGSASAEEVYRRLLTRSGLLRTPAEGLVDFVHRTFQDYLAARAVVEHRDFPLLVRNAHLDQWEDVVRMAVAHARPDERRRLITQLVKRGDKVRSHRVKLHLLATACLEHATELDPDVRREVEQRAAALLPPRTPGEAETLAAVGHVALELLPGPEGLTTDEAAAVVSVAAAVGTDAALPKLAEFRGHPSGRVTGRVYAGWGDFDPVRYRATVLSDLPPEHAPHLQVRTRAELTALSAFPDHPFLALFGDFTEEDISGALAGRPIRELSLSCGRLSDLGFLGRYRGLERLSLIGSAAVTDLSPVCSLPLQDLLLRQLPGVRDYRCLESLAGLRSLYVGDGMVLPGLDALPRHAPLRYLAIPGSVDDLTGIGAWPLLETLVVDSRSTPPRPPYGWKAVARLRPLTTLMIPVGHLRALHDSGIALPRVESLRLVDIDNSPDLRPVASLFPALRELILSGRGEAVPVDLSPLGAAPRGPLSVEARDGLRSVHEDLVPHVTVHRPPESRY